MKEYTLHAEQWLPRPRDEVFSFIADARNLEALTPRTAKATQYDGSPGPPRQNCIEVMKYSMAHGHAAPLPYRTAYLERFLEFRL